MAVPKSLHAGRFDSLEDEMVIWQPDSSWSPNRVDALVWVLTELMLGQGSVQAACLGVDPEPRRGLMTGLVREGVHRSFWHDRDEGGSIWETIDDRYWRLFGR